MALVNLSKLRKLLPRTQIETPRPPPPRPAVRPTATGSSSTSSFETTSTAAERARRLGTAPPVFPPSPAGDPDAARLLGLKYKDTAANASDTRVKQLQDDLQRLGYLPPGFEKNSGYGNRFGSLTKTAVEKLQSDYGLPVTGAVDAATVEVLRDPRFPPGGQFKNLAADHPELGRPVSPVMTGADGVQRQWFDHGSVALTGSTAQVLDASGNTLATHTLGTFTSAADANSVFLNQEGETQFYDAPGDSTNPKPYGPNDCGPTAALIALGALGLVRTPTAAEAPGAIDRMRDTILGTDSTESVGLGIGQVELGLEQYGATGTAIDLLVRKPNGNVQYENGMAQYTLEGIDAALARNHPVVIGGKPSGRPDVEAIGPAWARRLHDQVDANGNSNYLDFNRSGNFGHFCTVLGKTPEGNYLVADPLSRQGTIEATPQELLAFFRAGWGEAMEVAPKP